MRFHGDHNGDQVDAEKLLPFTRLDPNSLRTIAHRTVSQRQGLTPTRAPTSSSVCERAQALGWR
jgi:hypothetical protein